MKDITEERRKLTEMYFDLKERLDSLTKLEEKGLDELDIKGYIDLRNSTNVERVQANLQRETNRIVGEMNLNSRPSLPQQEQQELDKNSHGRKNMHVSHELVKSAVIEYLKNAGRPVKISDMVEPINKQLDSNLTSHNFCYAVMKRIEKDTDKLSRPMKGYIQYTY